MATVLITGASSGFGAMTVRELADAGHTVFAGMRDVGGHNAKAAAAATAYGAENGVDVRTVELDVSDQGSVDRGVAGVLSAAAQLDVVVHNAGHMVLGPTESFTPEDLAHVYDVNVLSTQRVNRAVLPQMRSRGDGLVVWVGSTSTRGGTPPYLTPYFAAKAAEDALAVSYAAELARFGVDTTIVVPGSFTTGTNHFANAGEPSDFETARAYESLYDGLVEQVSDALHELSPDDADPREVARAIRRVIETPRAGAPFGCTSTPPTTELNASTTSVIRSGASSIDASDSPICLACAPPDVRRAHDWAASVTPGGTITRRARPHGLAESRGEMAGAAVAAPSADDGDGLLGTAQQGGGALHAHIGEELVGRHVGRDRERPEKVVLAQPRYPAEVVEGDVFREVLVHVGDDVVQGRCTQPSTGLPLTPVFSRALHQMCRQELRRGVGVQRRRRGVQRRIERGGQSPHGGVVEGQVVGQILQTAAVEPGVGIDEQPGIEVEVRRRQGRGRCTAPAQRTRVSRRRDADRTRAVDRGLPRRPDLAFDRVHTSGDQDHQQRPGGLGAELLAECMLAIAPGVDRRPPQVSAVQQSCGGQPRLGHVDLGARLAHGVSSSWADASFEFFVTCQVVARFPTTRRVAKLAGTAPRVPACRRRLATGPSGATAVSERLRSSERTKAWRISVGVPHAGEKVLLVLALVLVLVLALGAGALGGLVGTGSSLLLLPVLVLLYGPRVAVPMMGIAAVLANIGRVAAWWRVIRWRPVIAYTAPGAPAAVLGAHTLLAISPTIIDAFLGVFFLVMIPVRRTMAARAWRVRSWQLAIAGAVVGFLTGLVLSTGPLSVPIFTGYGLSGGAFLGSEAASALLLYTAKLITFGEAGSLTTDLVVRGVAIGAALMIGPFLTRRFVQRLRPRTYALMIDVVLVVAAAGMFAATYSG